MWKSEEMSNICIPELLSACCAIAEEAGKICRSVFKSGDLSIQNKATADNPEFDPFTAADTAAQKTIVSSLHSIWPDLTIIGEEGKLDESLSDVVDLHDRLNTLRPSTSFPAIFEQVPQENVHLWVDPLDGTREYTLGNVDAVTVLIGIIVNGEPLCGIIHQPFSCPPRTIWGMVGTGVFGCDLKPPPSDSQKLNQGLIKPIVCTTISHMSESIEKYLNFLKPREVIKLGGCGFKILNVLEGRVDAYVYPRTGTKRWDTAAGDAIIRAAGGKLTDIEGNELDYGLHVDPMNTKGIIVSRACHNLYINKANL